MSDENAEEFDAYGVIGLIVFYITLCELVRNFMVISCVTVLTWRRRLNRPANHTTS